VTGSTALDDRLRSDPRALMRAFNIQPKKRLGQNFLVSPAGIEKVVNAARLTGEEDVLEIGAGLGTLSLALSKSAKNLVVVELDADLLPALMWVLSDYSNVRVIPGDILSMDPENLGLHERYAVVANIPYNITSHLIRKLMESPFPADPIVLTIQEEVARRITADPGDMSLLALSVQIYGVPTVQDVIPSGAFFPQPKVDSAVIRIDRFSAPRIPVEQLGFFFDLGRAGFGQRRKQLHNALAQGLGWNKNQINTLLEAAGISPASRAQELAVADWVRLTDRYASQVVSGKGD
jgi:16S rRNA (adenine1518-N6/adenine1519-N6)-dimethyltransferase